MEILRQAQDDRQMPDQVGHDGTITTSSVHNWQSLQHAARRLPGGLRRIPGRGSRRSCRGRDSPSEHCCTESILQDVKVAFPVGISVGVVLPEFVAG